MKQSAGVSARESEVLELVGEHRSNAEIAAALYISVRTVETHVSSLLRKLDARDRRELGRLAGAISRSVDHPRDPRVSTSLPAPSSPFIGRGDERRALRDAVLEHRAVTALGPGGVGKTRLALAVAADVAVEFEDGVWFVDLVPVTDPGQLGAAVAAALGVGEQQGSSIDEAVLAALLESRSLLVLDNAEHLAEAVAPFVERVLARCPGVNVLVTSRARLVVPFEWVYSVPPLATEARAAVAATPDAVALFVDRAAAVGCAVAADQEERVVEVCRKLDGIALAIELAAARLPALGLDGLLSGLSDHLRLLVGGYRADDRHRSVRAMLDWSQALLTPSDLTLLGRVSVFVAPFTVTAAGTVVAFDPLDHADVVDGLARLADQSLLSAVRTGDGTRYRALETIRQYGAERLAETGELDVVRARHLTWCETAATELVVEASPTSVGWRPGFDEVADEFRAALRWAVEGAVADRGGTGVRAYAQRLALAVAELAFARNLVGESQQRYEQAAGLADDLDSAAAALRSAAEVAGVRMRGDDAHRLRQAAAELAVRAGDPAAAARDLATAATIGFRKAGSFVERPPSEHLTQLLARARDLAGEDPAAAVAIALGDAAAFGYAAFAERGGPVSAAPEMAARAQRAVTLAHQLGDALSECAALQALTAAQRLAGETFTAAATAGRRVEVLESSPVTPAVVDELTDALLIATATSIGTGDLPAARRWGRQLRDLPQLAEVGHLATSRILMADALAGHAHDVVATSVRFLDSWARAGRPRTPALGPVAAAVAMVHGLRGETEARGRWLTVLEQLGAGPAERAGYLPTFDAIVLLHHGNADDALRVLDGDSDGPAAWRSGILLQWHLALRVEAAVLAGRSDAEEYAAQARPVVAGNPVADAILDRAAALREHDDERLLATAAAFDAAGCPYQAARTLVLADGDSAASGAAALAELGIGGTAARG